MFSAKNLQIYRGNASSSTQGKDTTAIHTFKDINSTVAIIQNYLPPYLGQGVTQDSIAIGDHLLIEGSDTTIFTRILSLSPFTVSTNYFSGGGSGTSIPVITGTQATILATIPIAITFGFATDTKQLLFYNLTTWVIAA